MQATLTIKHVVDVPIENDLLRVELEYINNSTVHVRLSGNGRQHNMHVPKSTQQNAVSYFLSKEPEELASKFDAVGQLANAIDGDWIVKQLLNKLETSEVDDKESLANRIQRLSVVNSLMVLHALGNDVMIELLGHNWVAEHSAVLVKRSKEWLALVERVKTAQEALKSVLPT